MSIVGYNLARLSINLLYKIKLCISRLNLGQKHELFLEPFSYRECSLCQSRFPRSSTGRPRVITNRKMQFPGIEVIGTYSQKISYLSYLRLSRRSPRLLKVKILKMVNTLGRPFGPSRQLLFSWSFCACTFGHKILSSATRWEVPTRNSDFCV